MVHDPEVGAIVVGSPTPFHAEQIIEAAKLGKHIFCEKVKLALLSVAAIDGFALIRVVNMHRINIVAFVFCFWPLGWPVL